MSIEREAIILDLQMVLRGSLTLRLLDYKRNGGRYPTKTIYQLMGSWGKALRAAGLIQQTRPTGTRSSQSLYRICLKGDHRFLSDGPQHRICDRCKETEAWKDSPITTHRLVGVRYMD